METSTNRVRSGFARRVRGNDSGQATIEYVGLAVALAVLLTALGTGLGGHGGKVGDAVAKRLTQVISQAGDK